MQFMLILAEDPGLVVTDEQRQDAVQRVGEYASLLGDGTLKGAHRCARSPARLTRAARAITGLGESRKRR